MTTPISTFRLSPVTKARLIQLAGKRTMTSVLDELVADAARESGFVAVYAINTRPEHDPYVNISGISSYTELSIDPRDRTAGVSQEYKTNSWTMDEHHRMTYTVRIYGHPLEDEIHDYLTNGDGQALMRRICDGWDSSWDGSNMVGVLNNDAAEALEELRETLGDPGEAQFAQSYEYWDIEEWIDRDSISLSAYTTDEKLAEMADEIRAAAEADHVCLSDDILRYLTRGRDELREEVETEE